MAIGIVETPAGGVVKWGMGPLFLAKEASLGDLRCATRGGLVVSRWSLVDSRRNRRWADVEGRTPQPQKAGWGAKHK